MTAPPAGGSCLTRRTGALLPGVLLVLLSAVASAVPLEPIHVPGLQDGGDYDSLIQPLVLALAGVAVATAVADRLGAPRAAPRWVAALPAPRRLPPRLPPSRAPPGL